MIMFWIVVLSLIIVIAVIAVIINSGFSENISTNGSMDSIYYKNKNYEYILDIISKCGYGKPVKLSKFLSDLDQLDRQSDLYQYLTSAEFKMQHHFFNVESILTNGKNDLILSVNEDRIEGHYNDLEEGENITSDDLEDILFNLEEYTESDDSIELPIRGINFRNLTEVNIGYFDGYIMPDKENKHDRYAIGIYGDDGTHFGFVEKGQKTLYDKIEEGSGLINVKLDIDTFIEEETGKMRFQGTVAINKEDLL